LNLLEAQLCQNILPALTQTIFNIKCLKCNGLRKLSELSFLSQPNVIDLLRN